MAFPPNAVFGDDILIEATDLQLLFGWIAELISALQHWFDGPLIHKMVFYQLYHQRVLQDLLLVQ